MAEKHIFVCDACAQTQESDSVDNWYRAVRQFYIGGYKVCPDCLDDALNWLKEKVEAKL